MEVERERQAALSELEADYNLERQNLLLQKAAAEQAERGNAPRHPRAEKEAAANAARHTARRPAPRRAAGYPAR